MTGTRELTLAVMAVVAVTVTLVALPPASAATAADTDAASRVTGDDATTALPTSSVPAVNVSDAADSLDSDHLDRLEGVAASALGSDGSSVTLVATTLGPDGPGVPVVAVVGYSRWDGSDPLTHETRDRLYAAVESEPGVSLSAVADRIDASRSTVRYHYRILEREGLVEGHKLRGRRCLFPVEQRIAADGDALTLTAALRDDARRDVLRGVYRTEPVSVSDLAAELDIAASTASHHLQRLDEDGLVEREETGRTVLASLTPATRSAVERVA